MGRIASDTTFNWIDQSQINDPAINTNQKPVILMVSTADKGDEKLNLIRGNDFYKKYVTDRKTIFENHGQALLECAALIDAGATLLYKRIVAPDALLANIIISVKITKVPGTENPETHEVTPPADGTPKVVLKFQVDTVSNAKSIDDVKTFAASLSKDDSDDEKVFPLFVITDTGRGVSNKKIRLIPNYDSYRELQFMRYCIQVIENTTVLENIYFALDQSTQYGNTNYGMDNNVNRSSLQIKTHTFEENITDFVKYVASILRVDYKELYNTDVLYGASRIGRPNPEIKIDEDSINLNNALGVNLLSGSDGEEFGPDKFTSDAYAKALIDVYNGTYDDNIYDLNKYQIDAAFDANYPDDVKKAIQVLADYRKDFFFFQDLGFVYTFDQIKLKAAQAMPSIFTALYHLSYQIEDPFSKKHIPVTCTYTLAKLFVNHFLNNKANPFEGILYGIILSDAIEGTVNYIPKKLPNIDQKQQLVDINVNYATYYNDQLVIESECTCQEKNTELSWINNVIAIQEVEKAIRVKCPKSRYTFIDADGNGDSSAFDNYKKDVEELLTNYQSNFKKLEFDYTYDETQVQNKQFYASIFFSFRDFMESEVFNLFAIN